LWAPNTASTLEERSTIKPGREKAPTSAKAKEKKTSWARKA